MVVIVVVVVVVVVVVGGVVVVVVVVIVGVKGFRNDFLGILSYHFLYQTSFKLIRQQN